MPQIIYEPFKSVPISEFEDELRFEFPDLPSELFQYYIIKAARMMARQGNLLRRRAIVRAQSGVTRYLLESPDGLDISGVLSIRRVPDGGCSQTVVVKSFTAPEHSTCCGRDIAWYDDDEGILHVDGCFCCGDFYVTLAVVPSLTACTLPERFLTEFFSTLTMGTSGMLMMISGRPWTNMRVGEARYNEFLRRISIEAVEVATHKQRGAVKMNFGRAL